MLTKMSEADWAVVLTVFAAVRSRRGDKGRDDRKFLEALHYFTVHNITWRALPAEFGKWNSVWKRFWRLSKAGFFVDFFDALAGLSQSARRCHIWGAVRRQSGKIARCAIPRTTVTVFPPRLSGMPCGSICDSR
jgi:transposase